MRISAAALATSLLLAGGCGAGEPELPEGPSCARAWVAITSSLAELHRDAGRALPPLPDRAAWIATCDGLGLGPSALACLEPDVAVRDPGGCATALAHVDRAGLDQPFLDAMLPAPGAAP